MGGCRCSYKNCVRATKNSEKDFHFFHYPVRDPERCTKWIANAKKANFQNLPEDQLRNKVICQLHFELQYFTNASRKRLVHNAVPTLDAGSEDLITEEMMNVQVLQSDSDGTVFTVDTDNLMHSEIRDVKSYVIKNGNLVPADFSPETEIENKPEIFKIDVAQGLFKMSDEITIDEQILVDNVSLDSQLETPKLTSERISDDSWLDLPNTISTVTEVSNMSYEPQDPLEFIEEPVVAPPIENVPKTKVTVKPLEEFLSQEECNSRAVINISKTIQRHSKDIACLKRILNAKIRKAKSKRKLTNNQIISNLRGLLPPTLCGAISLHLFKKDSNFTKDEKNFLITMFKASPAAYKILSKNCKWRLPDSDTVKKLVLNYVK